MSAQLRPVERLLGGRAPHNPPMPRLATALSALLLSAPAVAEPRFAEPPTGGLALPAAPLAGAPDGLNTFDLGVSARLGARFAAGARVRDLFEPVVGGDPVERRWAAELAARPLADDRLEVGLGAEVGERRGGVSPRLRLGV